MSQQTNEANEEQQQLPSLNDSDNNLNLSVNPQRPDITLIDMTQDDSIDAVH